VFGEQREHVIEKRNAGFNRRSALAVEFKADGDAGFFGVPNNFCLSGFHHGH
jgi:hypothetical protein